jgi:hypothetical protein
LRPGLNFAVPQNSAFHGKCALADPPAGQEAARCVPHREAGCKTLWGATRGCQRRFALPSYTQGGRRDVCLNETLFSSLSQAPGRSRLLAGGLQRRTTAFGTRIPHTAGVPKPAHRPCRQPR